MSKNFLESALYYAEIGYEVLPCDPGEKRPCSRLVRHGVKDATCDPETIRRWWTVVPNANIGIATGRSGILVIDLDRKQNKDGLNDIQAIANERDCDVQQVAQTPSGGEHWYYRQPEDRTFKASTGLGETGGIDVRSNDTYVLAPPSVIYGKTGDKKAYQWGYGAVPWDNAEGTVRPVTELTYPPEWLVEWLKQNPTGELPSVVGVSIESLPALPANPSDLMSRVYRYLQTADEAIQGQGGEKTTFRVLCAVFHGFDLTEPQLRLAFEIYNRKCTPAWSGSEAEHKISEVLKSTPSTGKQRGHLLDERRCERYDDKAYPECFYSNSAKNQPTNDRINDMSSDSLAVKNGMLAQDIEGKVCRSFPLMSMEDIQEETIEWLIPNFIPLKMLTGFVGQPDVGKSWLCCDLAARLSRGDGIPFKGGCRDTPCETLMISAEDSPGMIRERLQYAEADLSKIHILGSPTENDSGYQLEHFNLEMHSKLDKTLRKHPAIQLVIIDPISSYFGDANENRNDEVRRLLGYAKDIAEQRNIAVVFVTHNRKGTAGTAKDLAIDKVIGSRAIAAVPRLMWLVGFASEDRTADRHVALVKGNILSENERAGFAYKIVDKRIEYTGISNLTANELSAATAIHRGEEEGTRGPRRSEEREQCGALLRKELEKHGGILRKGRFSDNSPPHTLGRLAVDNGYTKNIFQLACKDLKLITWRDEQDYSWLCLPEAVNEDGVPRERPESRPETTTLSECAQILQSEIEKRDGRMPLGKFSATSELGTIGRLCCDHQYNREAFKKAKKELSLTLSHDDDGNTYYSLPKVKEDSVPVGADSDVSHLCETETSTDESRCILLPTQELN